MSQRRLEIALLTVGFALIAAALLWYANGRIRSHMSITRFIVAGDRRHQTGGPLSTMRPVDTSLWAEKRIHEYEATLADYADEPLAILRIDRIGLTVPVFNGTDDRTLNRGVGRIVGTARIGHTGNVGIAGHRDGFFRGLRDVNVGDAIQLQTAETSESYTVDSISIVTPNDVSVLESQSKPALTLVTCYPFYFIGSAPQRYIVHASLVDSLKPVPVPAKAAFENVATVKEEMQ